MGFTKIWERYFLKEVLKTFFLFLICFYGLYALIDYANQSKSFHQAHGLAFIRSFCIYYGCEFINRSEVLVPFAILLGTIRTLCKLNTNNELVAMLASGIKISRLLRPFLLLGFGFTGLMYLNMEYAVPLAAKQQKYLEDPYTLTKKKSKVSFAVEHVILKDGSTLLFQNFDTVNHLFFDVFWVRSMDDIYRIKYLYPYTNPPTGYYVDHLIRNERDELIVVDSQSSLALPELKFHAAQLIETLTQPENMSLSKLWEQLPASKDLQNEKEVLISSAFHRKLVLPWLCLLAIVGPAPFCIRFTRQFPTFLVYASCLFGLIAIYIVFDAASILGRRQFVDPLYALWTPFVTFFLIFGWRYVRVR